MYEMAFWKAEAVVMVFIVSALQFPIPPHVVAHVLPLGVSRHPLVSSSGATGQPAALQPETNVR